MITGLGIYLSIVEYIIRSYFIFFNYIWFYFRFLGNLVLIFVINNYIYVNVKQSKRDEYQEAIFIGLGEMVIITLRKSMRI